MPAFPRSSRHAADRSSTWTRSSSWTRQSSAPASSTWTRSTSWTRRATTTVAGTLGALVAFGPGLATAATVTEASATHRYVVRAADGQLTKVDAELRGAGSVVRQIRLINADVANLTDVAAARWSKDRRIVSVTRDAAVTLASDSGTGNEPADGVEISDVATSIGADNLYQQGITGQGVDVALIDSGVAPIAGLSGDKVIHGPDLSFDSQKASTRYTDGFGHGTHLAGIIAGHSKNFAGIAPDARLVSVKVADRHGVADVSQVIAGIDWVVSHAHSNGLNIRVVNLSFGTDSAQGYELDPLAYAAEQAWHHGIVVVVSVGNTGRSLGRLTDPAIDPFVLAVGAADTSGDTVQVAHFSARGNGQRNPDLVAPGAHIASLQPYDTVAAKQGGAVARKADGLFKGTGTSQAAAVASGAAALLLSDRPELTPDQVKIMLVETADRIHGASRRSAGHGMLNIGDAASAKAPGWGQSFQHATGTGSLEEARGSVHVTDGSVALTGEQDIFGQAWHGPQTDFSGWWGAGALTTTNWGAVAWATTNWASSSWASSNWAGSAWASSAWAGSAWAGSSWASSSWAGSSWASSAWG